jgi:N-acetylmuramoyl-L-alanine amidase
MKLKLSAILLSLMLCLAAFPTISFGAEAAIKLYMNEKQLTSEVAPRIVNDNTIVPVRIIAENIGAKVGWEDKSRKVTINKGDVSIELTINNPVVLVKGISTKLEVAPTIIDDKTMLPLRFIGEQLGVKFNWDELTRSVHMYKSEEPNTILPLPDKTTPVGTAPAPDKTVPVGATPAPDKTTPVGTTPAPDKTVPIGTTPAPDKTTPIGTTPAPDKQPVPSDSRPVTGTITPVVPVDSSVKLIQSIEMTATDLIVKAKDGEITLKAFKLSNPDRIVMDIPNSVLDEPLKKLLVGTSGELPSKHPLISKVRFSNYNNEPPTVRIILDQKEKADYKIIPPTVPSQITATIQTPSFKVVIDAGHGDRDSGAVSITGKFEKDFTLSMANKVTKLLSGDKRIEALMTRSDDTFVELDDRVSFANNNQADLYLSIHGNKFKPEISGTETYYYSDQSLAFANLIHKNTLKATGFPDRNVRKADFRVIKYTTMPAVLVEVGYLSNKADEASMYNEAFQDQVAASLASAIKEYLNIK